MTRPPGERRSQGTHLHLQTNTVDVGNMCRLVIGAENSNVWLRRQQGHPSVRDMAVQKPRYYATGDLRKSLGSLRSAGMKQIENCQTDIFSMRRSTYHQHISPNINDRINMKALESERNQEQLPEQQGLGLFSRSCAAGGVCIRAIYSY